MSIFQKEIILSLLQLLNIVYLLIQKIVFVILRIFFTILYRFVLKCKKAELFFELLHLFYICYLFFLTVDFSLNVTI